MRTDEEIYKSKDIGESAALVTCGQKVIDVQREGNVCWFVFEDSAKCTEFANEFFFGSLKGDLRQYNEAMNVLKNRIFSYLR